MAQILLEIGTEEIPSNFLPAAVTGLKKSIEAGLKAARLGEVEVKVFATPRRLAAFCKSVAERQPGVEKQLTGPPASAPRQAAEKFAASKGAGPDALKIINTKKGDYWAIVIRDEGRQATEKLAEVLPQVISSIEFPKTMRWADKEQAFVRPVHWIVALLDSKVISFEFNGVKSGRSSRGHRFLSPESFDIGKACPIEYTEALRNRRVIVSQEERRKMIVECLHDLPRSEGGAAVEDEELVEKNVSLTEEPHSILCSFEGEFLDLPEEVLIEVMKKHMGCFPVRSPEGRILPLFVAVCNGKPRDDSVVRKGYERVLKARLSDGRFFFDEDRKKPLAEYIDILKGVVFQRDLGTSFEKMERFRSLAKFIASKLGIAGTSAIERVAELCKADLTTGMVGEFPELQGVMGREYAKASGETDEVARGIFEHYLPRRAGDAMPETDAGAIAGIADRLDTVCGIIGIGKTPTGSEDPFALRRHAAGIINISLHKEYRLRLSKAVDRSLALLDGKLKRPRDEAASEVMQFIKIRLKSILSERFDADLVDAVIGAGFDDVVDARRRAEVLEAFTKTPEFDPFAIAFKRVTNISKDRKGNLSRVNPSLFEKDEERNLYNAFGEIKDELFRLLEKEEYREVLSILAGLRPKVDAFFDGVFVMVEDETVKGNRLDLLSSISAVFGRVADFSTLKIVNEVLPGATKKES